MKIEIIARPSGQAPELIREAWVGLELEAQMDPGGLYVGVLGGKASSDNIGGYTVAGNEALEALRAKHPEAARWWEENSPYISFGDLVFGTKFCRVVEE